MFSIATQRRTVLGIVALLTANIGLVAVGALTADEGHAAGTLPPMSQVEVAANALRPAVRLSQSGQLMLPMSPLPKCAMSKTSFGQPRPNGRVHEGIDIMASLGQEVYAVNNGVLWRQTIDGAPNSTLSGNAAYVKMADGTYYFYAHLSAFAAGLAVGDPVIRGQIIGYVGDTGDAGPGNYHLHFEVHPLGGAAVNPFPLLTVPAACTVWS